MEEEDLEHKGEVLVTITSKSSMVEEATLEEEELTKEVEVEQEGEKLSLGATSETCWLGHKSFECPGKEDVGQRGAYVAQNEHQKEQLTMV